MLEQLAPNPAENIGGTVVAGFVAVVVLVVVAVAVTFIASFFNYYFASMRAEAALFAGGIAGGVFGTYAARASCDAVIKSYSKKAIFLLFVALIAFLSIYEFIEGLNWEAVGRLAQWTAVLITSWALFWHESEI